MSTHSYTTQGVCQCVAIRSLTRLSRDNHILLLFTIEAPQEPLQLLSSAYNHHIDKTGTNPKLDMAFLSHHTKRQTQRQPVMSHWLPKKTQSKPLIFIAHSLLWQEENILWEVTSKPHFWIKSWLFSVVIRHEIVPATMQAARFSLCWPSVRCTSAPAST